MDELSEKRASLEEQNLGQAQMPQPKRRNMVEIKEVDNGYIVAIGTVFDSPGNLVGYNNIGSGTVYVAQTLGEALDLINQKLSEEEKEAA